MSIVTKVKRHGLVGSAKKASEIAVRKTGWHAWRTRNAQPYVSPTPSELASIEADLADLGIAVGDYRADPAKFRTFQAAGHFPTDYHGGVDGPVWDEKLLEHFIAAELLELFRYGADDVYVDVAAATSPWVHGLRSQVGLRAYAIDLIAIPAAYRNLPYYRQENATQTQFETASVKGASLHCAFEMFAGQDDMQFVREAARILAPGGKVVIVPLYMHTDFCAYSSPDFWGKGWVDQGAKEYVRNDAYGIRASRKYDAQRLKERVLDVAVGAGLSFKLRALRNKEELGKNIYCHFILELAK